MASTTPQSHYKNAVVLYHWRKCGYCVRLMPEWERLKSRLPPSVKVYEVEVEDHRETLKGLGVNLGGGVPRIEAYNAEGDQMVYDGARTADAMLPVITIHLISSSPDQVAASLPCTVLYFRHTCGFCVRFLPEFIAFATGKDSGTVLAVDTSQHPAAIQSLSPPANTVPHVVHHASDGSQHVFDGERTSKALRAFVAGQGGDAKRSVSFEGGSLMPVSNSTEVQLGHALDALQDRARLVLGKKFGSTFEPDNASVCFIGKHNSSVPGKDRIFILLCPQQVPRGKRNVMAGIYGTRGSKLTVKIYVDVDRDSFVANKRRKDFHPVLETNSHVQVLETFGYYVEMS